MQTMRFFVVAVVVSYNRSKLLQECLDGISGQSRKPDQVLVVDNASEDGPVDVVLSHPLKPDLIPLHHNMGGAGGFVAGMAAALAKIPPQSEAYLWLMDDDVVPQPNALSGLLDAASEARADNGSWPTVLGSEAVWVDGRVHGMNKPRRRLPIRRGRPQLQASAHAYQVRSLSFVSCLVNVKAIQAARTLPRAAFFLWNDDFEYTSRLLKTGIGYYVPASRVWHKTKVFGSSDADPGSRFFYEVRNKIWMFRFSRGNFTTIEFLALLLATGRRWLLTLIRAHDRRLILHCLSRGLKAGMATRPGSNHDLFAQEPEVQALIDRADQGRQAVIR